MENMEIFLKLIVALTLLNVWLIRFGRATKYRGGDARNMIEEFKVYGLPAWSVYCIGFLKIVFSLLLIASISYGHLAFIALWGLFVLMLGAIFMHVKVGDSLKKTSPSLIMFICLVILISIQ